MHSVEKRLRKDAKVQCRKQQAAVRAILAKRAAEEKTRRERLTCELMAEAQRAMDRLDARDWPNAFLCHNIVGFKKTKAVVAVRGRQQLYALGTDHKLYVVTTFPPDYTRRTLAEPSPYRPWEDPILVENLKLLAN